MQFVFWVVVPSIIANGARVSKLLGVIICLFCLQYIPKVVHMVFLVRRMQHVTGYIFGTAWWGFALNLIAYFIAAHVRPISIYGVSFHVDAHRPMGICLWVCILLH